MTLCVLCGLLWNEAAQRELDRIQIALNRVAESLESAPSNTL